MSLSSAREGFSLRALWALGLLVPGTEAGALVAEPMTVQPSPLCELSVPTTINPHPAQPQRKCLGLVALGLVAPGQGGCPRAQHR